MISLKQDRTVSSVASLLRLSGAAYRKFANAVGDSAGRQELGYMSKLKCATTVRTSDGDGRPVMLPWPTKVAGVLDAYMARPPPEPGRGRKWAAGRAGQRVERNS